jgi:hypothetical protein
MPILFLFNLPRARNWKKLKNNNNKTGTKVKIIFVGFLKTNSTYEL